MDQGNPVASIILSGAPKNCKLINIKNRLVEVLERKGSVNNVKLCRRPDGSVVDGKFIISLENAEDVERLVAEVEIDLEYHDDLYTLKVTRSRPSLSLPAQQSSSNKRSFTPPRYDAHASDKKRDHGSGFKPFGRGKPTLPESSDDDSISSLDEETKTGSGDRFRSKPARSQRFKPNNEFSDSSESEAESRLSPNLDITRLPKKPLDWFGLLQKNPILFEKYPNSCILVQEAPKNVTIAELNTHFHNRIREVNLLADGILVAFGNEKDAANVIRNRNHEIRNTTINVYRKHVPPVYDDRILIKGNFTQSSRDEIEEVLEGCTDVTFKVQKQRNSGMFLAVFDESIDIAGFKYQLKKLSLSNLKPQILEVCRSDCIKLQNVKKGTTVEKVRIAFMNKKLHDGDVTLVTQDESTNTALVYFANYKDAEKVAKASKGQKVKVAKQAVEISIFCPGIKGSVEISPFNLHQFTHELDVDTDIIEFILNSPDLKQNFHKEIGHLADVEFVHDSSSSDRFVANIKPLLSAKESQEMEQENFENDCKRHIQKFCNKCQVKTQRFGDEDRERVRKDFHWTSDAEMVEVKLKNETINVFVRWEDRESNAVKVVSADRKANAFLGFFGEKCSFMEDTETYEDYEFQILMDCGIVEETKNFFHGNVSIDVDKERRAVTYEGSRESVSPAKQAVKSILKKTVECDLTYLAPLQLKFLREAISTDTSSHRIDVIEYLRDKLKQNNIKVRLVSNGDSARLIYSPNKSDAIEKARVKIEALIKSQTINCPNGFDELTKEDEWKNLQENVESSGTLVIYKNYKASAVQLVGLPMNFEKALTQVTAYFKQNVEMEDKVELPYAQTMFMIEYPDESGVRTGLADVDYYKEAGGIHLKGRARLVEKAKTWIGEAVRSIQTEQETMKVPGMADFLRDQGGKQFLKTTSNDTRCVIQVDSIESAEWNQPAKDGKQEEFVVVGADVNARARQEKGEPKPGILETAKQEVKRWFGLKSHLTPQQEASVEVTVINGDILTSDCDVIINTVGSNYDLSASQLSAKLLAIGGQEMADECKRNPIAVAPGMFKITTAPNLPFKAIIHLITPDTADKIAPILKKVFDMLETQMQLQSLAIPAIGTGQLGLSSSDVAKTIHKAINDFKATSPVNLTRIDVVVFDRNMVNDFKKAFSKSQTTVQGRPRSTVSPPSSASASKPTPRAAPRWTLPIQVTVKSGDILTSNCDAMINTTGSDFNLTTSQVSSQVIKKGGRSIDRECKGPQQYQSNNYRISSGGKLKFQNIIHFVTPGNPQALSNGLEEVFALANDKLQLSSLAIPTIGAGNAQLPAASVAQAFATALSNFSQTNPKVLTRIDIVIFDQTLIPLFQNQISNANLTSSSSSASFTPKVASRSNVLSTLPSSDAVNAKHAIDVYLTSNSNSSRQRAWNMICEKADSKCDKRPVEDDVLETLDEDDLDEIMALEEKYHVTITRPDDSSKTNTLLISGLSRNVTDAYADALSMLHKYNIAMAYSDYVDWKFMQKQANTWESFPRLTNAHLETTYKENNNAQIKLDTKIKGVPVKISVDFSRMTMKRLDNQVIHEIKQFSISSVDATYPSNWIKSKPVQLVPLTNGSKEYNDVVNKFLATQQMNVVRIERIENKRLYTQFKAQKEEVEERMKKSGAKNPVTRELFHGTASNTCAQIYKSGFDRGFAGKNGTVHGRGVYFAVNSSYSNGYAQPDNQGERKMFLADVVTGEYCQGKTNYVVPPVRPGGQSSDLYDSVVDNMAAPAVFVVFKDASVYPLYLMTYK